MVPQKCSQEGQKETILGTMSAGNLLSQGRTIDIIQSTQCDSQILISSTIPLACPFRLLLPNVPSALTNHNARNLDPLRNPPSQSFHFSLDRIILDQRHPMQLQSPIVPRRVAAILWGYRGTGHCGLSGESGENARLCDVLEI